MVAVRVQLFYSTQPPVFSLHDFPLSLSGTVSYTQEPGRAERALKPARTVVPEADKRTEHRCARLIF